MSANDFPESFKDPRYAELDAQTEKKLGLPDGLLASIRLNGERSNHSQKSEADAAGVYQFIPTTRQAIIKKYGIDPTLSPENASEAAGLLLKEGLNRNGGDAAAAVGEYHGGLNRDNWGPRTRAYQNRVMVGLRAPETAALATPQVAATAPASGGQSMFQEALAKQAPTVPESAIAKAYQAYQSGALSPEAVQQFEEDVKSKRILLPQGAALKGETAPAAGTESPQAKMLPMEVTNAYINGQLSPEARKQLEDDMRAGLVKLPAKLGNPGSDPNWQQPKEQGIIESAPQKSVGRRALDEVAGAGETMLSLATGIPAAVVGMPAGYIQGMMDVRNNDSSTEAARQASLQQVERRATDAAQFMTYQPRSDRGRELTQAAGEAIQQLIPVMPLGAEMGALGAGAKAGLPVVQDIGRSAAIPVANAAGAATQAAASAGKSIVSAPGRAVARVAEMTGLKPAEEVTPTPATTLGGDAGAAATDMAAMRRVQAEGVGVNLTEGEATRNAEQLSFEKEQAKGPLGDPLRQRSEQNHQAALQKIESLIDETGGSPQAVLGGGKLGDVLSEGWNAEKSKTRVLYKRWEKSTEAQAQVDQSKPVTIGSGDTELTTTPLEYLNSKPRGTRSAAFADDARKTAVQMGIATMDDSGNLMPRPATALQMENFRKEISGSADPMNGVHLRDETILKKLIDAQTESVAGPLAKEARTQRANTARKYEDRAIIKRLITDKRGSSDPSVAVDQVFQKTVLNGTPEELTFLNRVLQTNGEVGRSAWADIQAATADYIRSEATKNNVKDSLNRDVISSSGLNKAVRNFDQNGRLDVIFGKKNAQTIRDINEVMQYVETVPPNTLVNRSGTAMTMQKAGMVVMDGAMTGVVTGLPFPVISAIKFAKSHIADAKIKAKIQRALNNAAPNPPAAPPSSGGTPPTPPTPPVGPSPAPSAPRPPVTPAQAQSPIQPAPRPPIQPAPRPEIQPAPKPEAMAPIERAPLPRPEITLLPMDMRPPLTSAPHPPVPETIQAAKPIPKAKPESTMARESADAVRASLPAKYAKITDNQVAAAQEILEAARGSGSKKLGLRVIDDDVSVGEKLRPSRKWMNGEPTKKTLPGTSAVKISGDIASVVDGIHGLGALGKNGPNGYYPGKKLVLVKGATSRKGADSGEIMLGDAEVIGVWEKENDGLSSVQPKPKPRAEPSKQKTFTLDNLPPEKHDYIRMFHGGTGQFDSVPAGGNFEGFFAHIEKGSSIHAHGSGDNYFADIPESKILKGNDAAYIDKSMPAIRKIIKEEGIDKSDFDTVFEVLTEDLEHRLIEEDSIRIFGRLDGIGEIGTRERASWVAQKLRGRLARYLGFKAVEMNDEHGTSYLMVPGVKLNKIVKPE